MEYFFLFIWFITIALMAITGTKVRKNKKRGNGNSSLKSKMLFIISIIASLVSFIGVGVTANETNQNEILSNLINNINLNEIDSENLLDNLENQIGKAVESITENKIEEIIENKTEENKQDEEQKQEESQKIDLSNIPEYSGKPFVSINGNVPFFKDEELTKKSYEKYSSLDRLGRCGIASANIGKDIMPTEERKSISSVKPTGWQTTKYDNVNGKYLYNRCHLIGFQLSGENANEKNLITGTRYLNVDGMLPFENMVADYIKETGNHVLYRVTPIFKGNNLVASGVLIEAKSVEDNGAGILFNVYCYNVQPGIEIDYATGKSSEKGKTSKTTVEEKETTNKTNATSKTSLTNLSKLSNTDTKQIEEKNETSQTYILNTNTKKFHYSNCASAKKISDKNRDTYTGTREGIISRGYSPCGNCDP